MNLRAPVPPNLPLAPREWNAQYQDQFANALRLYFNQINGLVTAIVNRHGGQYLNFPYGSFTSNVDQTAASTTTAYAMTYNTVETASGVTVRNDSRLYVSHAGVYNLQFSTQFTNTDSQEQDISVWFRVNGVDVPDSNSQFTIAARHGSTDGALIAALNIFLPLKVDDYAQIMWSVTSTTVSIQHLAAQTGPVRPATPSVIATMAFVSTLPE